MYYIRAFFILALLSRVDEGDVAFLLSLYHKIAGNARGCEANHAVRRVYNPQLVAVYHQCEALYLIKPQGDARWRVMIYSPTGADAMHRTSRGDDMPSLRLG